MKHRPSSSAIKSCCGVAGVLLLTASIGVCIQALRITGLPDTHMSLAKLVAGGRVVASEGNVGWQDQLTDFYGTIIETLESA